MMNQHHFCFEGMGSPCTNKGLLERPSFSLCFGAAPAPGAQEEFQHPAWRRGRRGGCRGGTAMKGVPRGGVDGTLVVVPNSFLKHSPRFGMTGFLNMLNSLVGSKFSNCLIGGSLGISCHLRSCLSVPGFRAKCAQRWIHG